MVGSVKQKMGRLGLVVGTLPPVVPTTTSPEPTWFDVCGNRKFKSAKLVSEDVCPACGEEMKRCAYWGKRRIPKNVGAADYKPWFTDEEFDESGEPNYVEMDGGGKLE